VTFYRTKEAVWFNLGECYAEKGMIDEAIAEFKKILKDIRPGRYFATEDYVLAKVGYLYLEKNMPEETVKYWNELIEKYPKGK
jgi:tetratricopeptide (TPR) repeat protein